MPIAVSTADIEVKTSLKANKEWNLETLDLEGNEGGKVSVRFLDSPRFHSLVEGTKEAI
jgi:hypothetical protein